MDELIKQVQVLSDYILQRKVTFAERDLISEEMWWIKNYKLNFLDWLQIYQLISFCSIMMLIIIMWVCKQIFLNINILFLP